MWEPGAQHTCVIITSVQAACHIWQRGAENHRGTAEKTKKSQQCSSFFFFLAKIWLSRKTSTLCCRAEETTGLLPAAASRCDQNRKSRGYSLQFSQICFRREVRNTVEHQSYTRASMQQPVQLASVSQPNKLITPDDVRRDAANCS